MRTKGAHDFHAHDAKRSRIKPGERSRRGPHVRRSRRKGVPGARTEGSTPGRISTYNGGAAQKRLQVVLDEKSYPMHGARSSAARDRSASSRA